MKYREYASLLSDTQYNGKVYAVWLDDEGCYHVKKFLKSSTAIKWYNNGMSEISKRFMIRWFIWDNDIH